MATRDRKVEMLGKVAMFAGCNSRELQRIASIVDVVHVQPGEVLIEEGAPARECFIVADGKASVTSRRRRLATLGPGSIAGEMALLDNSPRSATVVAETPMDLYVLDARSFSALLRDVPSVSRKIMATLAKRLRETVDSPAM